MSIPHPFPYQGSKRKLSLTIASYIPQGKKRLIEPFAGSAAVSLAALAHQHVQKVVLNDLNAPLMSLWRAVIYHPDELIERYALLWHEQLGNERDYYNLVRDKFNSTHEPEYLLYLLLRCVKASVRYNAQGQFNQSPDHRRKGTKPQTLYPQILHTSRLLKGRVEIYSYDYADIVSMTQRDDVVYLDPPYQGVTTQRDKRYLAGVSYNALVNTLETLNAQNRDFIVSYDGRTGTKTHGQALPDALQLVRLEMNAGRSSQATLLGQQQTTIESLYLSKGIVSASASSRQLSLI